MQGQSQTSGGIANLFRMGPLRGRAAVQVAMIVVLLIGVVFVIISFASRSQAARSSFVQAHGVRREAVILSVDNIAQKNGSGSVKTYVAEVLVRLADPVDGQTQTTVHVPNRETEGPGGTLTLLVDPDDPGYAELPGSPYTPGVLVTILLAVGAFLIVVAAAGSALIARSRRRSRHRAAALD